MRRILVLTLSMIIVLMMCASSAAHPGSTDEDGGHHDSSTGEYHYHHGYPAHQHENGVCPYDYDDRTGLNSGGSSYSDSQNSMSFGEWMERQNASYGASGITSNSSEEIGREWASLSSPSPVLSATPSPVPSITPGKTFLPVSMSSSSNAHESNSSEFVVCVLICLLLFLCIAFANRRAARALRENKALGCLTYIIVMVFISVLAGLISSCDVARTAEIFRSSKDLIPLLCFFALYAVLATSFLISEWKYEATMRNESASLKYALECKTREAAKLKDFIDASGIADPNRIVPQGSKIGDDGLPCDTIQDPRFRWGECYTFFTSRNGIAFHRYGCDSAGNAHQVNAVQVYGKKRPCRVCKPSLPDLSWYFEYQKRKEIQDIVP